MENFANDFRLHFLVAISLMLIPIMISLGLLLLWAKFGHLENIKRKGIMIGTGVLLFNLGILYALSLISTALMTQPYFFYAISMSAVSDASIIAIFILSYYFAGKYCAMHWPEPPRKWAKWLAFPWISIIVGLVIGLISVIIGGFTGSMWAATVAGRGGGGVFIVLTATAFAFIADKVSFLASYKGANDGHKIALTIANQALPLREKRELLDKQLRAEVGIADDRVLPLGEKRELPGIFTGIKALLFLKPDLKKIIVFLALILPLITFSFPLLPAQFDLLNMYLIQNYIIVAPSLITACFLGGYDCGEGLMEPKSVAYIIIYAVTILLWYFVSCIIVSVWNRILNAFGEKKNHYEKMAVKYLVILFILIAIIIPIIGSFSVFTEMKTRQSISVDEIFRGTYPTGTNLQEIKLRNYFFFPIPYKLPDVTFCIYDADENFKIGDLVNYRTEDGKYIADMDKYHRNVIVVSPFGEIKVYLNRIGGDPLGKGYEKFKNYSQEKYDEILLLKNVGMNNYNYCYDAKEDDIVASEKINISK